MDTFLVYFSSIVKQANVNHALICFWNVVRYKE